MKLLLDEHYSVELAAQLHGLGHDVLATAAAGMAGTEDEPLLSWADSQERVLMTNNVQHFVPIHAQWMSMGRSHHGLWLTDDRRMPRARNALGLFVSAIDGHMTANPSVDAFVDQMLWLP